MSRRRAVGALIYAAPLALLLVAGSQVARVQTQHLTAWKGGGFGMFSSLDLIRVARVHVITEEEEALVPLPNLPVHRSRLLASPDSRTLARVASRALEQQWFILSYDDLVLQVAGLPDEVRRGVIRSETDRARSPDDWTPYPARAAFAYTPARDDTSRVVILGARAAVFAARFDPLAKRLTFAPLNRVSVPAQP